MEPIKVSGELAHDAELRFTPGAPSRALLFLTLKPIRGFPFVVAQDCGCDPAQIAAAQERARSLRRGAPVTVFARGITPRTDHGQAVLKLEGVSSVVAEL